MSIIRDMTCNVCGCKGLHACLGPMGKLGACTKCGSTICCLCNSTNAIVFKENPWANTDSQALKDFLKEENERRRTPEELQRYLFGIWECSEPEESDNER